MANRLEDGAEKFDIEIPEGDDFCLNIMRSEDVHGAAIDTTGATWEALLYDRGNLLSAPVPSVVVVDASITAVQMILTKAQTVRAVLTPRSGEYILRYTLGGVTKRLISGQYVRV